MKHSFFSFVLFFSSLQAAPHQQSNAPFPEIRIGQYPGTQGAADALPKELSVTDSPNSAHPPSSTALMAPAPYSLCYDFHFSPYAGGEDLLFAHRLVEKTEGAMIRKSPVSTSQAGFARTWRLGELTLLWMPLNYLAMVTQHEVFGHGYRIRDIHRGIIYVAGYSIGVPPPYGYGGGGTNYTLDTDRFSTTQDAAVSMAGVESTAILAFLTKMKWLQAGKLDPRQAVLYLLSQHDLNLYIGTLKDLDDRDLSGHDMHCYLQALNYTYPDNLLGKGRLRSLSWINLADPFTFYAIYAWFHYIASGKEASMPMIGSCYLPGLRLGLTPFGPEVFFENFFSFQKKPLYVYLKGGNHSKNTYLGLGLFSPSFFQYGRFSLGARLDAWRQPLLLLSPGAIPFGEINFSQKPSASDPLYPVSLRRAIRYGGSLSFLLGIKDKWGTTDFELGYKTKGFLPGYSLWESPTVRISYNLAM